jgi:hypothetical protein
MIMPIAAAISFPGHLLEVRVARKGNASSLGRALLTCLKSCPCPRPDLFKRVGFEKDMWWCTNELKIILRGTYASHAPSSVPRRSRAIHGVVVSLSRKWCDVVSMSRKWRVIHGVDRMGCR